MSFLPCYPAQPALRALLFVATLLASTPPPASPAQLSPNDQLFYTKANVHPYLDNPLDKLLQQIPELQGLHPAPDQQPLLLILSKTGHVVETYFENLIDLVAHEDIDQEKLDAKGAVKQKLHLQYNYMIVLHREELPPRLEEYRTDAQGNRVRQNSSAAGFNVTTGYALICIHFLPGLRSGSTFKYLGDQQIGSRSTYVVAFAQQPERATPTNTVSDQFRTVPLLVQGIAWIDQESSQILRIRTDLLAPRTDIGLTTQTTQVTFSEVRLPDVLNAFWLPQRVTVSSNYMGQAFRNEHLYSNYQQFRVSVKMSPN